MVTLQEEIRSLEERLLSPAVRGSADELSTLLADDFLEFGKSGRSFGKQSVIESLTRGESTVTYSLEDFAVRELCIGVALATYHFSALANSGELIRASLRSSIWVFRDSRWQMLFHQGTPVPQQ